MASLTPPEPPKILDAWANAPGFAYRIITDKPLVVGTKSPAGITFTIGGTFYVPVSAATSAGAPTDLAGTATPFGPHPVPDEVLIGASCVALTAPDSSKVAPGTYPARQGP